MHVNYKDVLFVYPMINTIIIQNQNITGLTGMVKLIYNNRKITALLVHNSLSGLKPHLFCASVHGCIHFQQNEIKNTIGIFTVTLAEYKEKLLEFLPTYVNTKKMRARTKMDLLKLYLSINDTESAVQVLKYMKPIANVKMLSFILKNNEMDEITDFSRTEKYSTFLKICKKVDYHTGYIFAVEMLHVFNITDLVKIYEDLELIFGMRVTGKLMKTPDVQSRTCYKLKVLLCIKIISELTYREKYQAVGTMLIYLANCLTAVEDIQLLEEILSLAFGLINSPQDMLDDLLSNGNLKFHLTGSQEFYIKSRFLMREEKISCKSQWQSILVNLCKEVHDQETYTVGIMSYNDIFEFSTIKRILNDMFTEKIRVTVKNSQKREMTVMGVVDNSGCFYASDRNVISPSSDISGGTIILSDGLQIKCNFEMKKLEKETDIVLVDVSEVDESARVKEKIHSSEKLRILKFVFKDDKKCNYSFKEAVYRAEDEFIELCFPIISDKIVGNVEISPGIYEKRIYEV